MAVCKACGERLSSPVYRTREPRCYVFRGKPDDFRNGLKFHTRAGVVLDSGEESLVVPVEGVVQWIEQGWQAPRTS